MAKSKNKSHKKKIYRLKMGEPNLQDLPLLIDPCKGARLQYDDIYCYNFTYFNGLIDKLATAADSGLQLAKNGIIRMMSFVTDLEPEMNIVSDKWCQVTSDVIDMRAYIQNHNIFTKVQNILAGDVDTSLLWAPNEYTDVELFPNIIFRLHRLGFDVDTDSVEYILCAYQKYIAYDTKYNFMIPLLLTHVKVSLVDLKAAATIMQTMSDNYTEEQIATILHEVPPYLLKVRHKYNLSLFDLWGYIRKYNNVVATVNLKSLDPLYYKLFADINHTPDVNSWFEIDVNRITVIFGQIFSALIVFNNALRTERISRPITAKVNAQPGEPSEPKLYKTRILGDTGITITSLNKPEAQSFERIVKYSTPEWPVKGYIRTLSDGRIIEVRGTTAHRRCVDLSHIEANPQKKSTTYVISAENGTNIFTKK